MGSTDRFEQVLATGGALDEGALLIAAHARAGLDVDAQLERLDALAAEVPEASLESLLHVLFERLGFAGNHDDYYDPLNSLLDRVLDRRLGIPITLAVVTIEVGRRVGVELDGVGMPGHFLVRERQSPERFVDVFDSGRLLDAAGCAALFRKVTGASHDPLGHQLHAVGTAMILRRMLGNLDAIYAQADDRANLAWVRRLAARFPGTPPAARRDVAQLYAAAGRFDEAGRELLSLAGLLDGGEADAARRDADRLFARLN